MGATTAAEETPVPGAGPIECVILDLDGTLADTPQAIAATMVGILGDMGRRPDEAVVRATVGKPLDSSFARLLEVAVDHADVGTAIEAYKQQFGAYIDATGERLLYPGVVTGLNALRQAGLRLTIATSKVRVAALRLITAAGIDHLFDVVAGHDSVGRGKPHPDMALHVAEQVGCEPGACVVVGDGVGDIEMGCAAGMPVIGVTYGVATAAELQQAGATTVVGSFADVVATVLAARPRPAGTVTALSPRR